jgi:hypothetical protein
MSVFFAVVLAALGRAMLAGYAGLWFAPVVAMEALDASWPFLAIGAAAALLRRAAAAKTTQVAAVETMLASTLLIARFGKGWIEPHTSLAESLAVRSGVCWPLVGFGVLLGIAAVAVRRRHESLVECALDALAGFLIVGPEVYGRFDDVEGIRRLSALAAISAGFAIAALLAWGALARSRRAEQVLDAVLVAASAVALLATVLAPGVHAPAARASVILVAVDTLRADALERTKQDGSILMPRLTEIARSGVRFTQAITPAPWTLPSMVSLLSGMNPHRHRTGRMNGLVALPGDPHASWSGPALRAAGYQAAGFVNNPWLRR